MPLAEASVSYEQLRSPTDNYLLCVRELTVAWPDIVILDANFCLL